MKNVLCLGMIPTPRTDFILSTITASRPLTPEESRIADIAKQLECELQGHVPLAMGMQLGSSLRYDVRSSPVALVVTKVDRTTNNVTLLCTEGPQEGDTKTCLTKDFNANLEFVVRCRLGVLEV